LAIYKKDHTCFCLQLTRGMPSNIHDVWVSCTNSRHLG